MTHSCVWHDSFICVRWLIHACDMTHSMAHLLCDMTHRYIWYMTRLYVWLDSFIRVLLPMYTPWHDLAYLHVRHDLFIYVTWLIHMCDANHLYVWRDSFISSCRTCEWVMLHIWSHVTRANQWDHVKVSLIFLYVWHDSLVCSSKPTHRSTRLIHMCDMTYSYVWRDSFIRVTRLSQKCDITESYEWHDWEWLWYMRGMTNSYEWHGSFIRVKWLLYMCDMTHSCVWYHIFIHRHHFSDTGNGETGVCV